MKYTFHGNTLKPSLQHAVKNNLAEAGFGRLVFLIKFTVNRYGKAVRCQTIPTAPVTGYTKTYS